MQPNDHIPTPISLSRLVGQPTSCLPLSQTRLAREQNGTCFHQYCRANTAARVGSASAALLQECQCCRHWANASSLCQPNRVVVNCTLSVCFHRPRQNTSQSPTRHIFWPAASICATEQNHVYPFFLSCTDLFFAKTGSARLPVGFKGTISIPSRMSGSLRCSSFTMSL